MDMEDLQQHFRSGRHGEPQSRSFSAKTMSKIANLFPAGGI